MLLARPGCWTTPRTGTHSVTCLLPPQVEVNTVWLRHDILKPKAAQYPVPKLIVSSSCSQRGQCSGWERPWRASLSAVQQRPWATSHMKHLHFLGAQVPTTDWKALLFSIANFRSPWCLIIVQWNVIPSPLFQQNAPWFNKITFDAHNICVFVSFLSAVTVVCPKFVISWQQQYPGIS
jgi:hypothetical protein